MANPGDKADAPRERSRVEVRRTPAGRAATRVTNVLFSPVWLGLWLQSRLQNQSTGWDGPWPIEDPTPQSGDHLSSKQAKKKRSGQLSSQLDEDDDARPGVDTVRDLFGG